MKYNSFGTKGYVVVVIVVVVVVLIYQVCQYHHTLTHHYICDLTHLVMLIICSAHISNTFIRMKNINTHFSANTSI